MLLVRPAAISSIFVALAMLTTFRLAAGTPGGIPPENRVPGATMQDSPGSAKTVDSSQIGPNLDPYGGLVALASPNGGSGFFRVEKFAKRWVLVTPTGHAFWMFSVQNIGDYFFAGRKYSGKPQWATQVRRRLKDWGFNTTGEFGAAEVWFGRNEEMPFLCIFRPVSNAIRNTGGYAHEAVKDIYANIPPRVYNGYRGLLVDTFDPKYAEYAKAFFDSQYNLGWIPGGAKTPWLIGYSVEDGDEWFGLTVGAPQDKDVIKPHPAWAVLVSMDPMRTPAKPGSYPMQKYADLTNYSKQALRDFLKSRYNNSLAALNTNWRSSYTSWDHDGGYAVGNGFLDEGGQHAWVASHLPAPTEDWNTLDAMTPAAKKDMDDFLEAFTEKISSVAVNAIRARDPHHLIFSPDTMNQWGFVSREPVLRAAAKWFDVLHVGYQEGPVFPTERLAAPSATYDIAGKPMVYWIGLTANKDSSMSAFGDPYGVDHAATQVARGEKYAAYINHLFNVRGSNGDYPSLGIDFWGWEDQSNEKSNWGLVSARDNAYDGTEAHIATGKDRWGFPVGGETGDYGDFLSAVRAANLAVYQELSPPRNH
jgi:hypothetical protein